MTENKEKSKNIKTEWDKEEETLLKDLQKKHML